MSTMIKTNIEARYVSLSGGSSSLSLFDSNNIECHGVYLSHRQEYTRELSAQHRLVMHVFQGVGDLRVKVEGNEVEQLQVTRGDVLFLPPNTSYQLVNETSSTLILSETIVSV